MDMKKVMDWTKKKFSFDNLKKLKNVELKKIQSLRVQLTYVISVTWLLFISFMCSKIDVLINTMNINQYSIQMLDKIINIFMIITFILFVLVFIYVLGKQKFTFKAFGVELTSEPTGDDLVGGIGNNVGSLSISNSAQNPNVMGSGKDVPFKEKGV